MTAPTTETSTATPEPTGAADNDADLYAALTGRTQASDADRFAAEHLAPDAAGETQTEPGTEDVEEPDDERDEAEDAPTDGVDPASAEDAPEPDTTPAEADPFAVALSAGKPLAYKVNGQEKVFDAIVEVDGKGALIPAEKVAEVRNLIARAESNAEANRELYRFKTEVDRLGGVPKFHEAVEQRAMTDAASVLILNALTQHPAQFVNADGSPNRERIDFLIQQATVHAERAKFAYRTEREQQVSQWREEETVGQVRETALPNAIAHAAQQFGLDERDVQAAQAHFAPFADALYFKATPEQAAQFGVPVGTLMVDLPKMEPWFRDRAERKREQATVTQKREAAQQFNAARTVQTTKPKPQPPRNPSTGQFTKDAPKRKMSVGEMKRRALAGKPIPGDDDYTED